MKMLAPHLNLQHPIYLPFGVGRTKKIARGSKILSAPYPTQLVNKKVSVSCVYRIFHLRVISSSDLNS